MQLTAVTLAAFAGLATAGPADKIARAFGIPTDGGFPTPNAQQLVVINTQADGTLSNAPPPPKLADSSLVGFQVISMQETFEVAFFSSLINNITTNAHGYEIPDAAKKAELVEILETVLAVRHIPLPPHPLFDAEH